MPQEQSWAWQSLLLIQCAASLAPSQQRLPNWCHGFFGNSTKRKAYLNWHGCGCNLHFCCKMGLNNAQCPQPPRLLVSVPLIPLGGAPICATGSQNLGLDESAWHGGSIAHHRLTLISKVQMSQLSPVNLVKQAPARQSFTVLCRAQRTAAPCWRPTAGVTHCQYSFEHVTVESHEESTSTRG